MNTLELALTAAPWLLLGFAVAGLVQALVPQERLQRWLGGDGIAPVVRGAVIGAPLPLCSCGAIPTALALHRAGASRGASTAFLVGTPGVGVDSVALTYALLGPFMAAARLCAAVATAVAAGLAVGWGSPAPPRAEPEAADGSCGCTDGCSGAEPAEGGDACEGGTCSGPVQGRWAAAWQAVTELIDDIGPWLLLGLLVAGALLTLVPVGTLAQWGSGPLAMLAVAFVGVPLYLCATAVTPVAAGLLAAGVSPGTVLVLLIAGPITSAATLAVLRRELGSAATAIYLAAIVACALVAGLITDALAGGAPALGEAAAAAELVPMPLKGAALGVLLLIGIRPLRSRLAGLGRRLPGRAPSPLR